MHIPGYRFIRKINHGGMSTVYLAIQESVGRVVALKVMSPALDSDPSYSERFQREANIVGQLSHPHIVSIYDIGRHNNYNYIAMDYLPGGSIHDRMLEGINATQALKILKEVGSALDHSHERGYVHRDIKPENILFRDDGSAVLTDFGVARAVAIGSRSTHAGTVVGTPHYMSPEQTRGKVVDARSDLYSLGIVFYEMLTGSVPYQGEEPVAIALKHLAAPLPTLPAQFIRFQPILDKLLDKDPQKRYQNGRELVTDIEVLQLQMREQGEELLTSGHGLARQFASLFSVLLRKTRKSLAGHLKSAWLYVLSLRYNKEAGFHRVRREHEDVCDALTQQNTLVVTRVHKQYNRKSWREAWMQLPLSYRRLSSGALVLFVLALALLFFQSAPQQQESEQLEAGVIGEEHNADDSIASAQAQETASESSPSQAEPAQAIDIDTDAANTAEQNTLAQNNPNQINSVVSDELNSSAADASTESTATDVSIPDTFAENLQQHEAEAPLIEDTETPAAGSSTGNSEGDNSEQVSTTEPETTAPLAKEKATEKQTAPVTSEPTPPARFPLTVNSTPKQARIRIMNIKEKYRPGIALTPGRYHIEVTAPGYAKHLEWVQLKDQALSHSVILRNNFQSGNEFQDSLASGGKAPPMVVVPAGKFTLGGPDADTQPYRTVTFNKPFAVSKYEVTFAEYERFAQSESLPLPGDNKWGRADRPVINVSWEEASEYARWLSQQTGKSYRLPTEAEWEYVAKVGKNTAYWWGNDVRDAKNKANCRRYCDSEFTGVFTSKTAPIGSFDANPFGIHDIAGNVAEWTTDCYKGDYQGASSSGRAYDQDNCPARVIRGGSMRDGAEDITSFKRRYQPQHTLHEDVGIRLVVEP